MPSLLTMAILILTLALLTRRAPLCLPQSPARSRRASAGRTTVRRARASMHIRRVVLMNDIHLPLPTACMCKACLLFSPHRRLLTATAIPTMATLTKLYLLWLHLLSCTYYGYTY